jgi:hypothetical protein
VGFGTLPVSDEFPLFNIKKTQLLPPDIGLMGCWVGYNQEAVIREQGVLLVERNVTKREETLRKAIGDIGVV